MILEKLKSIRWPVLILYAGAWLLFSQIIDMDRKNAKVVNHLKLPVDYLVEFTDQKVSFDEKKFKEYKEYYKLVAQYVPRSAAAHGMLAFCYYHLGDHAKAIHHYKRALKYNPYYFWFNFNLGAIYYELDEYEKAIEAFTNATKSNPEIVIYFIKSSSLLRYAGIKETGEYKFSDIEFKDAIVNNLRKGYDKCYELVALSRLRMQRQGKLPAKQKVILRIF